MYSESNGHIASRFALKPSRSVDIYIPKLEQL